MIRAQFSSFFFNDTATTEIYTLSLHDALPISAFHWRKRRMRSTKSATSSSAKPLARESMGTRCRILARSEEHTSELQSRQYLVCRLLLEKKKNMTTMTVRSYKTVS